MLAQRQACATSAKPIAVCVAATRAEAEDLAEQVELDYEELPAVADMLAARAPDAPLVHEHWADNVFLETRVDVGRPTPSAPRRRSSSRRTLRTARQCMAPLEGRGVVAEWDRRLEQLVLHTSTQMPHIVRTGLAEMPRPGRGGGSASSRPMSAAASATRASCCRRRSCAGCLARRLGHPVRWIEDRREQLTGNANCREHHYDITAYADRGRHACWRSTARRRSMPAPTRSTRSPPASRRRRSPASCPAPTCFGAYRCRTWSVGTNKPPILPYRGVARAGVVLRDGDDDGRASPRAAGLEPHEVRLRNLVPPEAMPFDNITAKHFDSGDYPEVPAPRGRGHRRRPPSAPASAAATGPVRLGVGLSIFCEQGAHGTSVYAGWGIPMVPGYEQAVARLTPDGGLEMRVGIQSHGQGLETTLAQVAHEVLGHRRSRACGWCTATPR